VSALSRRRLFARLAEPPPITIAGSCLAARGIACDVCRDACDPGALSVSSTARGAPRLDAARCTACGKCAPICPVGAITLLSSRATSRSR